ncbi:MAG TPA: glycosyltransferase family 2 protein, partial [Pseudolysinimonas sp.]|nr:glycosyltransferase family 2 protein [Pseudolysinimonas sp.]
VLAPIGYVGLLFLDEPLSYLVFRSTWIGASCLYVFTVAFGLQMDRRTARSSWRQAIAFPGVVSIVVMISAFDPDLFANGLPHAVGLRFTTDERLTWTVFVYLWISLSMVVAWLARDIEGTRVGRHLTPLLVYLVGYGPLLCAVAVDAYVKEFRRADARWEKTEKIGRVAG